MTIHDLKPGRLLPGQVTPAAFWEGILETAQAIRKDYQHDGKA